MELDLSGTFKKKHEGTDPSVPKRMINPQSPITSMALGDNQFTIIADTHHGMRGIVDHMAKEMPKLGLAGLKHLILEVPVFPDGHFMLKNSLVAQGHRKIEDILKRMNARPPQIDEAEILRSAYLFSEDHDKSTTNEVGKAKANLLVQAMKAGITVHFAGDDKGMREIDRVERLADAYEHFIKKNSFLAEMADMVLEDPTLIQRMKIPAKEKKDLAANVDKFIVEAKRRLAEYDESRAVYEEARLGYATESERADRFIQLAKGEPALLVFGNGHLNKPVDLNEILDLKLRAEAMKKGEPLPARTPVVEIWDSRKGQADFAAEYNIDFSKKQQPAIRVFADTGEVEIPQEHQNKYRLSSLIPAPSPQPAPELAR